MQSTPTVNAEQLKTASSKSAKELFKAESITDRFTAAMEQIEVRSWSFSKALLAPRWRRIR